MKLHYLLVCALISASLVGSVQGNDDNSMEYSIDGLNNAGNHADTIKEEIELQDQSYKLVSNELIQLTNNHKKLYKDFDELTDINLNLETQVVELQSQIGEKEYQIRKIEQEKSNLERELQSLSQHNDTGKGRIDELQKKLTEKIDAETNLKNEQIELRSKMEGATRELENSKTTTEALQREIETIKGSLDLSVQENLNLKEQILLTEQDIESKTELIQSFHSKYDELNSIFLGSQASLKQSEEEKNELQEEIKKLQEKNAEGNSVISELNSKNDELLEEKEEIQQELNTAKIENELQTKKIESLKEKTDQLKTDLKKEQTEIEQLKKELEQKIGDANNQKEADKNYIALESQKLKEVREKNNTLLKTLKDLEAKIKSLEEKSKAQEKEIENQKKQIEVLNSKLYSYEAQINSQQHELDEEKESHNVTRTAKTELEKEQQDIARLLADKAQGRAELDRQFAESKRMVEALSKKTQESRHISTPTSGTSGDCEANKKKLAMYQKLVKDLEAKTASCPS